MSALELNGMIASIAHLAYHLGAIRQIDKLSRDEMKYSRPKNAYAMFPGEAFQRIAAS